MSLQPEQLKTKWLKDGSVDGNKIKIKKNQSIKGTKQDGSEIELLKLNATDKIELLGAEAAFKSDVESEALARQSADGVLSGLISAETNARQAAISAVELSLSSAVTSLQAADSAIEASVTGVQNALAQEILDRQSADVAAISEAKGYTDQKVSELVDSAPAVLDTLKELATALGNDANFATTVSNQLGTISSNLTSEITRAQNAESALSGEITAVSNRVTSLETFGPDQIVYVSKNGIDTNSGKQHKPFLTISAAMAAISDASPTKRYIVKVASGNYTEASLALKANVFIVGEGQKESVRITGAISLGTSFTAGGSVDNRSGFSNVSLLSAANFDWNAVQSGGGKLYFNEVVFASTVNLYGYNNAIAQAQFNACVIFGDLTISGINVGVFSNNICFSNVTLNQHPNGGMATILTATGGYCSGTVRHTTTVNDFNRRSASFLRGFPSENLIVDGPASYCDADLVSGSKQGVQKLNGGNFIALNPKIGHDLESQMIKPLSTNSHNLGDWGKQWMYFFAYVHASSGTDLYLTSVDSFYDAAGSGAGYSVNIEADGYGLKPDVNGGNITIKTANASGTGVRGKVVIDAKEIDVTSKKITNLSNGTVSTDAINKGQLDSESTILQGLITSESNRAVAAEAQVLVDAKAYTDSSVANKASISYVDTQDAATLASAKSYTDGLVAAEQSARESADIAIYAAIEAKKIEFGKTNKQLLGADAFVDLDHKAIHDSLVVFCECYPLHKDTHYTASDVGGVTRLTFINFTAPGQIQEFEAGETIHATYAKA